MKKRRKNQHLGQGRTQQKKVEEQQEEQPLASNMMNGGSRHKIVGIQRSTFQHSRGTEYLEQQGRKIYILKLSNSVQGRKVLSIAEWVAPYDPFLYLCCVFQKS